MKKKNPRSPRESGQMLLIIVLTMIVALTVGLSLVTRTITNLRLSRQNEESQRAFQAAEAGIQQALESAQDCSSGPCNSSLSFLNNAEFTTSETDVRGSDIDKNFLLNGGDLIDQGIGIDVWLSDHPNFANPIQGGAGTTVTVYWATENQSCSELSGANVVPVLEVSLLVVAAPTYNINSPSLKKYIYDPCSPQKVTSLVPNTTPVTIDNVVFNYNAVINIPVGERALVMKVIPYFGATKMAVSSSANLPLQGKVIISTGTSGETARKVTYFTSHPQIPPEVFPYVILTQ